MKRCFCVLSATTVFALLVLAVAPLQAEDTRGTVGLGLHGGIYKLGLTDHQDAWTPGWLVNGDVKYGLTTKLAIGVEGSWMKTYLADLSEGSRMEDGAGLSFDKIEDGPQQRAYLAGLFGKYNFLTDRAWSPYVTVGAGMYFWEWTDSDGNTLYSDDPSLDPGSDPRVGTSIFTEDLAGNPYELKDQELYAGGGLGLEFFPSEAFSVDLGAKFRYLTHVLTDFTDDKDVVGTDPGQLDLPRAIGEVYAGLNIYFGAQPCPPVTTEALATPASGSVPLPVQFEGTVSGGCPKYTYAWSFGDGVTSSDPRPTHTYETVGDYVASLSVTDSEGNISQSSVTVSVRCPRLTAVASADHTEGQVPFTVNFDGSATGGCPGTITYDWDFGDGTRSSEQSPSHTYDEAGSYTVSLTIMDSNGESSQRTVSITASPDEFIPTPEKPVVLKGVNFEYDKAVLLATSRETLDRVAASLIAHPEVSVEVGGHCDSHGSDAYNLELSRRRAAAVRDYLVKKGVPATQLTTRGYGETQPVADNNTAEGRAQNRRVELKKMQ